jgi:predicted naringenin-chalcone synthase
MWNELFQGIAVFVVFVTVVSAILWIIRTIVEYRRWYRTSKVQTEVHTKLMDRFTSNEDLMAYIQTPSGRRFLESTPLSLDAPPRTVGAPLSRILWSLQAGVVLAVASFGLLFTSNRVMEEVSQPLFAIGVLVLALGIGFVVSAAASFLLSRRLGLLDPAGSREHTGGTVA